MQCGEFPLASLSVKDRRWPAVCVGCRPRKQTFGDTSSGQCQLVAFAVETLSRSEEVQSDLSRLILCRVRGHICSDTVPPVTRVRVEVKSTKRLADIEQLLA